MSLTSKTSASAVYCRHSLPASSALVNGRAVTAFGESVTQPMIAQYSGNVIGESRTTSNKHAFRTSVGATFDETMLEKLGPFVIFAMPQETSEDA